MLILNQRIIFRTIANVLHRLYYSKMYKTIDENESCI